LKNNFAKLFFSKLFNYENKILPSLLEKKTKNKIDQDFTKELVRGKYSVIKTSVEREKRDDVKS